VTRRRPVALLLWALVAAIAAAASYLLPADVWRLSLRLEGESTRAADFAKAVSIGRLTRIERAVRVYYDSTGQYPRTLEDLLLAGLLDEKSVKDPFGRPYRYILRSEDGKFGLYGRNSSGAIDLDLSFDRTLAPVAEIHPARSRIRQQERRPGVQVIE
jgi:hypothetical protein